MTTCDDCSRSCSIARDTWTTASLTGPAKRWYAPIGSFLGSLNGLFSTVFVVTWVAPAKPSNFLAMKQLRNAPPSNRVKNKSDKVNRFCPNAQ